MIHVYEQSYDVNDGIVYFPRERDVMTELTKIDYRMKIKSLVS